MHKNINAQLMEMKFATDTAHAKRVCEQTLFNAIKIQSIMDAFRLEYRSVLYTVSYRQDG